MIILASKIKIFLLGNPGLLAQKWAMLGVKRTEWCLERVLF